MKTPNHAWIKYPKILNNKISHGTLELEMVADYKPEWHSILKGEVVSAPESNDWGIMDKIVPGMIIYFHYLIADDSNILHHEGEQYLKVPLNRIFCYVLDGKITAHAGYVLAKPAYEEGVEEVDVEGKKIAARVSKSGLVTSLDVSFWKNVSKISFIGLPLEGAEDLGVVPGDMVVMEKMSHQKYIIEGSEYFVYEQCDLLAKIDD